MKLTRIGVGIAKQVFQRHGTDRFGQIVGRRHLFPGRWLQALCEVAEPGCAIGIEACCGPHHWARQLRVQTFGLQ